MRHPHLAILCLLLTAACNDKNDQPVEPPHETCEEANLATSNWHCGACDRACGEHGQCSGGQCKCAEGWLDCDHNGSCESYGECTCVGVDLFTSHDHCGYCGHACDKNAVCQSGRCKCRGYWNDCDGDGTCETLGECPQQQLSSCDEVDTNTSNEHCGECNHACGKRANCKGGVCVCEPGWEDCDGNDTCETNGQCTCRAGDKQECYDDPTGKVYVERDASGKITAQSRCKKGHKTCVIDETFGARWSTTCHGAVYPSHIYSCSDPTLDIDCDGVPESQQDDDGDGHTICKDGRIDDCCDNPETCPSVYSTDLIYIHSGREDCIGNELDDNCNGDIDEGPQKCAGGAPTACDLNSTCGSASEYTYPENPKNSASTDTTAKALARAMDICLDYDVKEYTKKPGIIEYLLTQSDSDLRTPLNRQRSVSGDQINVMESMETASGTAQIKPRAGNTFAVLSTGEATDARHRKENGMRRYPEHSGTVPSLFLNAHGDSLETFKDSEGKSVCLASSDIWDSVHLHLRLRAPENAKGLSFDFRFYTQEYPDFLCQSWNDFFLALLTDELGNPFLDINGNGTLSDEDGNISFDSHKNPISVNSAFFTSCASLPCIEGYDAHTSSTFFHCGAFRKNLSCNTETEKCNECPDGTEDLYAFSATPYDVNNKDGDGGATAWLTTTAPIEGGKVYNLDFYIWDTGDQGFDSTVLLDNFQWLCNETTVGTDFARQHEIVN